MDMELKARFEQLWAKYFGGAELPIVFFYTDAPGGLVPSERPEGWRCVIADLAKVRRGQSLCLNAESFGCPGGKRYAGFSTELMPGSSTSCRAAFRARWRASVTRSRRSW